MPSRDYLIRQIEEMGLFLALLLRRLLQMKEENRQEQMEAAVKDALLKEVDFDIDQVVVISDVDFLKIVEEKFTSRDQIEKMADILSVLGQEIETSYTVSRAGYLKKSLLLYVWLQESSADFSMERDQKISEVQELIRIHGLSDEG